MKMIFWSIFSLISVLILFLLWSSYPWSINSKNLKISSYEVEPVDMIDEDEHPSVVKILTYNIGFLYGRGSEGPGYEHRDLDYYQKSLEKVSAEIKAWDADILCLQEVDFSASRSHYINQAKFIAEKAGYPYVAEAVSWEANYIPFPYWPLKNNFGSIVSGGAILSKFPLLDHEVNLFAKPQSQPWWYNLFYPHRYAHVVTVEAGEKKFKLMNLHLEAFDKADRKLQVERISNLVKEKNIDIAAGDFNMLPSSASKKSKFYNDDNYVNDPSYDVMSGSGLLEVVPNDIYAKNESLFFTFPAWTPDRRLDYIWYRPELKMMKAEVLNSASSDHLPLRASFQIDGPRFNPYSQ